VDTVLLCTLTALAVLIAGPVPAAGDGTALVLAAFGGVLGAFAPPLLALLIAFFALATVLCWSHYGAECLFYFTGDPKCGRWLLPVTAAAVLWGAVAAPEAVWGMTDLILSLMTLLNLAALLRLRGRILRESGKF
jgi:AGCS family alanine or glycine:cation symporter